MSSNFHNRDLQYIVSYLPVNGSLCGQLQPLTYLIPEYSKIKPWMRPNRSLTLQRQLGNDKLQVCKQLSVIILTLGGANQDNCMGVIQGKCKLFSLWSTLFWIFLRFYMPVKLLIWTIWTLMPVVPKMPSNLITHLHACKLRSLWSTPSTYLVQDCSNIGYVQTGHFYHRLF